MAVRKLTVVAMLTALICIVGPLTLPVGPIPVSLTSAVLLLTACLLGGRRAALCAGVYLLIGLTGLPVLAGFTGGAARLLRNRSAMDEANRIARMAECLNLAADPTFSNAFVECMLFEE